MKPEVFIRADGNNQIGLGHLIRCLALAEMLKEDFKIRFVSLEMPEKIKSEIVENGLEVDEISSEEEFFARLNTESIVVLDGYKFDREYQQKVKDIGCKLVCLDDVFDREFVADLIINHAPGITESDYKAADYTTLALGPEYALLRPAFLDIAVQTESTGDSNVLLICFGGSDSKNLTKIAAETALDFDTFKKIIIITGSAYKHRDTLLSVIQNRKRIEYHHAVNEQNMVRLMAESGVAIVPSSGIFFEVLAAGCKAISGIYTDNQKRVYSGFKKLNAIIDAGTFRADEIRRALKKTDHHKTKKIIDGKSPERIRNLFKNL